MMLTDLADVLRRAGLQVIERPGWQTRGHGHMAGIQSITLHHTAGPASGDIPSLNTVENGRPNLKGPLAQLMVSRSGVWYVIAAGLCWHTGVTLQLWQSNSYAIGIEAEATGKDEWPITQYESMVQGVRALCAFYRVPYGQVVGHKEICSPPGRKIDPNFDVSAFRGALSWEPDVALTDQEIERIARRTAELTAQSVWNYPVQNVKGDWPSAAGVIVAAEGRAWDVQDRIYEVREDVRALPEHMASQAVATEEGEIDLDALADRIIERMAARMGGT